MAIEEKRAVGRHARTAGVNKRLLQLEKYRQLALELPLAAVAVGLLDRTIEIVRETSKKKRRRPAVHADLKSRG